MKRRLLYIAPILLVLSTVVFSAITPAMASAADAVQFALDVDQTQPNLNNMAAAADDKKGDDSFQHTEVIVKGGTIFGDGAIFHYNPNNGDNGYVKAWGYAYTYDYYCVNGTPQTTTPASTDDSYKIQLSVLLKLDKNFNNAKSVTAQGDYITGYAFTPKAVSGVASTDKKRSGQSSNGLSPADFKDSKMPESCLTSPFTYNIANNAGAPVTVLGANVDDATKAIWTQAKEAGGDTTDVGTGGEGDGPAADDSSSTSPKCESKGDPLNWIICPIFNGVAGMSDWMFSSVVEPLLKTTPISTNPKDPTYQVWSSFRIYGNVFLVIALLILVFGQSAFGGLIDAYTVKKMLPRLLIAVVLINLSIYIVAFAVDVTNILGGSIGSLMTQPLKDNGAFQITPSGVQQGELAGGAALAAGTGLAVFAVSALLKISVLSNFFSFALLFIIMPVALGMLMAFVTLILRQSIILALVLVSPVAFALYCLPNTEKYFRRWWSFLLQTLAVYPIIIVFFAVSDILSVTINQANPKSGLALVISFVMQFLPLVFIPYSFRLAGGAIGKAHDVLTSTSKRGQEAIKGNPNDANALRNKVKRRTGAALTQSQAAVIQAGKGPGASRFARGRMRFANTVDGRVNERQSRYTKEAGDLANMISSTGNDDDLYAANWFSYKKGEVMGQGVKDGSGNSLAGQTATTERFFDSKGRERSESYVKMSEGKLAANANEAGRSLEYPVRKIQTDDDMANYQRAFAATSIRQGLNSSEMAGVHAAATFEHKDKFPELYHESPSIGTGANGRPEVTWSRSGDANAAERKTGNNIVGELHKTKQAFQLGSIRDGTLRSWDERRNRIQTDMDTGAAISHEDATFFAQTDELLETMVTKGVITRDGADGPEMSASGASAASQGALKALMANRRYETAASRGPGGAGDASANERAIYRTSAVDRAVSRPAGTVGPVMSRDAAIAANAVQIATPAGGTSQAVAVTGDAMRSSLPDVWQNDK